MAEPSVTNRNVSDDLHSDVFHYAMLSDPAAIRVMEAVFGPLQEVWYTDCSRLS